MPIQKFVVAAYSFTSCNTASDYKIKPLPVYYSEILFVFKKALAAEISIYAKNNYATYFK